MAKNLYFSRDSKLYVEFDGSVWQVPVLDGFSFSQSTNTSEITLSEMQDSTGLSRRGRRVFTDSLAPVEWSFSSYVRPYIDSSQHSAVEAVLWAVMAGADKYTAAAAGGIATATISTNIDGGTPGVYTAISQTSTNGTGTGALFTITVASNGTASLTAVSYPGSGYAVSNTVTIDGDTFGDTTGDLVITVSTIAASTRDFTRATNVDTNNSATGAVFTSTTTKGELVFAQSNRSVLGTCNLYFVMSTDQAKPMVYKITKAAINEASIDFEVDGIASIGWSGNGATIVDMQSASDVTVATSAPGSPGSGDIWIDTTGGGYTFKLYNGSSWVTEITTATASTSNFIRNRLTQLLVTSADTTTFPGAGSGVYNLTITGGNITVSNNITYLTPEELGKVNVPIEHVTGARSITGNFTCYLGFDTAANGGTSSDFFNDLTSSSGLQKVVNDFNVTFQVGGSVASTPRMYVKIPKCHIEVPNHSIEDVISIETNFSAYTTDFSIANEASVEYYGITV